MAIPDAPQTPSPYINVNDPYYARLHVLDSAGNITRMYQIPKKVLAEKSGFFRTLFSSSFREATSNIVRFPDDHPRAFHEMLQFIQGREVNMDRWEAVKKSEDNIDGETRLKIVEHDRALQMLSLADKYDVPALRKDMTQHILHLLPDLCRDKCRTKGGIWMSPVLFADRHFRTTMETMGEQYPEELFDGFLVCNLQTWMDVSLCGDKGFDYLCEVFDEHPSIYRPVLQGIRGVFNAAPSKEIELKADTLVEAQQSLRQEQRVAHFLRNWLITRGQHPVLVDAHIARVRGMR